MVLSLTRRAFLTLGGVGVVGAVFGIALRRQGLATGETAPQGTVIAAAPVSAVTPTSVASPSAFLGVTPIQPRPTATIGAPPPTLNPNADIRAEMLAIQAKIDGRPNAYTLLIPAGLSTYRLSGIKESGHQAPTVELFLVEKSNEQGVLSFVQSGEMPNGIDTYVRLYDPIKAGTISVRGMTGRFEVAPHPTLSPQRPTIQKVQLVWQQGTVVYELLVFDSTLEDTLQIAERLAPVK